MDLNVRVVLNKPRSYLDNETDRGIRNVETLSGVAITITQISHMYSVDMIEPTAYLVL